MRIHLLLFLATLPVFGTTSITSVEPTQTQAKITVQTDQSGFCTYRASRGTAFGTNIPDLADNTATDARTGSIVNGRTHVFVLGTRKANDALAAAATYWTGVTCGTDSEVSAVFTTRPIQWGNTTPDIVPFNSSKFGNMDHPAIDWSGTGASWADPATHSYVDPNTGVEYWVASHPGWGQSTGLNVAQYSPASILGAPIDVTGGKWATTANITSKGASFSVGSGGASDPIFIPLNNFGCPAGGGTMAGFGGNCTIDDVSFDVYCGNGAVSGITLTLQLARFGATPALLGNPITTSACPATVPVKLGTYPNIGGLAGTQPMFKGWGLNGIERNHIMPPAGNVNVSGTAVTLTGSPTWQNFFDLGSLAGAPILINGSYAHLSGTISSSNSLTIQENLGTLTNVPYVGVELGLVITKSNNGSNLSVSVALNYATSEMPSACCNGDNEMLNLATVQVSKSADGTTCGIYTLGCSAGTLNPPLAGSIGFLQSNGGINAIFLWIPRNSDGSPRAETRLLSLVVKPPGSPRTVAHGDDLSGQFGLNNGLFFDNVDGTSIYGQDQGNRRLWRLTYNESYAGCAGYVSYHPYPTIGDYNDSNRFIAEDCFTYSVLTPLSGGKDLKTQIMGADGHSGAYQSGLNYLGQAITSAHPGFDLGWVPLMSSPISADGGLISVNLATYQNGMGLLASFADDGTGLFVLKSLRNMWNDGGLRWGGTHTCPVSIMGAYRFCVIDPLEDSGHTNAVFPGRNRATLSQVNRAGFGSTAVWDSNTAVTSNTDFYTCPSGLPAPFTSLSSTLNCLQVRVNTPFCQVSPNSTYTFPDGKTEKDEFPCTTPGFGVANASYSKLQDIQLGDWLYSDIGSVSERFVMVTAPVYNSATDITFWVLRTMGYLWNQPVYGSGDETNGSGHTAAGLPCCTHANAWYLWAAQSSGGGNSGSAAIDVSSPANNWLTDNPLRYSGHGSSGRGASSGLYSFAQGGSACQLNSYCGGANLTPMQHITSNLVSLATQTPSFAGISSAPTNSMLQTYSSSTQGAAVSPYPYFVDFRHINPSGPSTSEGLNGFGNSFTTTLVAGTTKTYLISADCCVSSPDYKRWGLQAFAGRYWMKDVSGPVTFGSVADLADWSVCLARNGNECVFGSSAGQRFVTVPKHDIQPVCSSSNFGQAVPCVGSFGPWTSQTVQFRIDKYEPTGRQTRKLGFAHMHLGLPYTFSNCRPTPDGQFMFCPGYWLDGIRTEWLALRIGAQPPMDNVDRTTFVPVTVAYQGVPFAANIRARFGYAENGGDLLQCTAYGQDCSTEIPSGAGTDPFSFTNEAVTRQACVNGANCTITIPSLANRVLYYVVDRLDSSGTVLETSPLQAVAVP